MNARVMVDREGVLARVTLSHPGKFNAMSRAMWRELREIFDALGRDEHLRCVVIAGADGHFCAGGDIAEYPAFRYTEAGLADFHENDVWGGLQAVLDCELPVVAAIAGNCMGAGLEIASCCDIRLATASSRYGAPIARLGFPMAPREAALVAAELGVTTVRAMLLEAALYDAQQLLASGFLTRVVSDGALAEEVAATLVRIVAMSPQAARLNKRTVRALRRPIQQPEAVLAAEPGLRQPYAYADSAEHREGIAAFLEKRKPTF